MDILKRIENIRLKWVARADGKYSELSTHLPYALCEDVGIDTDGMRPREAWEAYEEKTGNKASSVKALKMASTPKATAVKHNYSNTVLQEYEKKAPKSVIDKSVPTLKNWSKCADQYMENAVDWTGKVWGMTPEELAEVRDKFQGMLDKGDLICGINSTKLESVLEKGLLNQFQTGTSDGSYNLDWRRALSKNLFGADSVKDEEREKYGYVAEGDDYEHIFGDASPGYGYDPKVGPECAITMRRSLANRTTYTCEDSLDATDDLKRKRYAAGIINKNCSIEGLSYSPGLADAIKAGSVQKIGDIVDQGYGSYIECQFHGPVNPSDIESLKFASRPDMMKVISGFSDKAWDTLIENGIKIGCFDKDRKLIMYDAEKIRG